MDYKVLAENLGLEEDEFFEMTALFIEVSLSDLHHWEAGLKGGDSEAVADAAHSIKGAAINLGFKEISRVALDIEMKARNKNLDGASEAIEEIREMLNHLEQIPKKLQTNGN